jgi:hypothetical protein
MSLKRLKYSLRIDQLKRYSSNFAAQYYTLSKQPVSLHEIRQSPVFQAKGQTEQEKAEKFPDQAGQQGAPATRPGGRGD